MHAHSMCANIKGSPPESSSPAVRMGCQNPASAQAPISTGVYSRRCRWVFCWDIVYESLASCYLGGPDPSPGKWVNIKEDLWQQVPAPDFFPCLPPGDQRVWLQAGNMKPRPSSKSCKNRHHFCYPGSDAVLGDITMFSFFDAESCTLLGDLIICCFSVHGINKFSNKSHSLR